VATVNSLEAVVPEVVALSHLIDPEVVIEFFVIDYRGVHELKGRLFEAEGVVGYRYRCLREVMLVVGRWANPKTR
jgi:hypothetical protein